MFFVQNIYPVLLITALLLSDGPLAAADDPVCVSHSTQTGDKKEQLPAPESFYPEAFFSFVELLSFESDALLSESWSSREAEVEKLIDAGVIYLSGFRFEPSHWIDKSSWFVVDDSAAVLEDGCVEIAPKVADAITEHLKDRKGDGAVLIRKQSTKGIMLLKRAAERNRSCHDEVIRILRDAYHGKQSGSGIVRSAGLALRGIGVEPGEASDANGEALEFRCKEACERLITEIRSHLEVSSDGSQVWGAKTKQIKEGRVQRGRDIARQVYDEDFASQPLPPKSRLHMRYPHAGAGSGSSGEIHWHTVAEEVKKRIVKEAIIDALHTTDDATLRIVKSSCRDGDEEENALQILLLGVSLPFSLKELYGEKIYESAVSRAAVLRGIPGFDPSSSDSDSTGSASDSDSP